VATRYVVRERPHAQYTTMMGDFSNAGITSDDYFGWRAGSLSAANKRGGIAAKYMQYCGAKNIRPLSEYDEDEAALREQEHSTKENFGGFLKWLADDYVITKKRKIFSW